MIKKVTDSNLIPDDIKELLYVDEGEIVPIGLSCYEITQFSIIKYFKLLEFISKYYSFYNDIFNDTTTENLTTMDFINKLSVRLIENNLIEEFLLTLFPEIKHEIEYVTYDQFKYLLGVIYRLNFLSEKKIMKQPKNRAAIEKALAMLGLQNLQLN